MLNRPFFLSTKWVVISLMGHGSEIDRVEEGAGDEEKLDEEKSDEEQRGNCDLVIGIIGLHGGWLEDLNCMCTVLDNGGEEEQI